MPFLRSAVAGVALVFVAVVLIVAAVGGVVSGAIDDALGARQAQYAPSQAALADIPENYLRLYRVAGAKAGLDWTYLAALGKIESDHGRLKAPGVTAGTNGHGCCAGPMQMCVIDGCPRVGPQHLTVAEAQHGTWRSVGVDGNGDGQKNPWDPADAIPAAAVLLKHAGAPQNWHEAIFAYNHAEWYVARVLATAASYRAAQLAANLVTGAGAGSVLNNPRVDLGPERAAHAEDIRSGRIDSRILTVMALIARSHSFTVTSLRVDHTDDGGNHPAGRAMDIGAVDGEICTGTRSGACGRLAVDLSRISGPLHSSELIYCFDPDGDPANPDGFARSDHCNHIHFGYDR